jgi:hypothetical protein
LGEEGRRLTTWRGRDWRIEEEAAAEEVGEGGEEEEEAWWWGRRRSRPPASRQRRTRSASMADREVGVRRKEGRSVFLLVGTAAAGWRTVRSGFGQGWDWAAQE